MPKYSADFMEAGDTVTLKDGTEWEVDGFNNGNINLIKPDAPETTRTVKPATITGWFRPDKNGINPYTPAAAPTPLNRRQRLYREYKRVMETPEYRKGMAWAAPTAQALRSALSVRLPGEEMTQFVSLNGR